MDEPKPVNYQRLISEESTVSADSEFSREDYENDIYEQLPSAQRRLQHKDQAQEAEFHWKPNQPLKMLPLCIQEKRNIRDRQHLERHKISYWESWKHSQETARRRLREQVGSIVSGLLLWKTTLHTIEGRYGVGVKAYFVFLRYLLCLNFLNLAIIAVFVLSPTLYKGKTSTCTNRSRFLFPDIFLGSGFMEHSPVFYGFYTYQTLGSKCLNTALLFFLGILIILLLNLMMIVRRMVVRYKYTWLTGINFNANMSYKVFCGWDFCIQEPEAACLKHNLIRNELKEHFTYGEYPYVPTRPKLSDLSILVRTFGTHKMDLEEEKFRQKVLGRSLKQWFVLYMLRVVLNSVVLVLLAGSIYLIFYATTADISNSNDLHWTVNLLIGYRLPITITVVNYVMPHFFSAITAFEDYSLTTQLNVTLVRSILLKLGSLAIYLFFFIQNGKSKQHVESEFGKEMYKLTIFHLLASFCNTFLVAYPRKLLVENCLSSNVLKKVGKHQFVIPLNVLDLVYSQTVTWVGVFYCPLLPAISMFKLLAIFYISKFNLVQCCDPAKKMFRTSSSSVLFHFLLLLGLIMSAVTHGVTIQWFVPSACGPFQTHTVYNVTSECVSTLPYAAKEGIRYMTSEAFALMLIFLEIIILTSYVSRGRANQKAMERLKDMLVMCSSDKRHLVKHHATLLRQRRRAGKHSGKVGSRQ